MEILTSWKGAEAAIRSLEEQHVGSTSGKRSCSQRHFSDIVCKRETSRFDIKATIYSARRRRLGLIGSDLVHKQCKKIGQVDESRQTLIYTIYSPDSAPRGNCSFRKYADRWKGLTFKFVGKVQKSGNFLKVLTEDNSQQGFHQWKTCIYVELHCLLNIYIFCKFENRAACPNILVPPLFHGFSNIP